MRVMSSPEIMRKFPPAPSSVANISGSVVESHPCSGRFDTLRNDKTAMARRDAAAGAVVCVTLVSGSPVPNNLLLIWPASTPKTSAAASTTAAVPAIHPQGVAFTIPAATFAFDTEEAVGGGG